MFERSIKTSALRVYESEQKSKEKSLQDKVHFQIVADLKKLCDKVTGSTITKVLEVKASKDSCTVDVEVLSNGIKKLSIPLKVNYQKEQYSLPSESVLIRKISEAKGNSFLDKLRERFTAKAKAISTFKQQEKENYWKGKRPEVKEIVKEEKMYEYDNIIKVNKVELPKELKIGDVIPLSGVEYKITGENGGEWVLTMVSQASASLEINADQIDKLVKDIIEEFYSGEKGEEKNIKRGIETMWDIAQSLGLSFKDLRSFMLDPRYIMDERIKKNPEWATLDNMWNELIDKTSSLKINAAERYHDFDICYDATTKMFYCSQEGNVEHLFEAKTLEDVKGWCDEFISLHKGESLTKKAVRDVNGDELKAGDKVKIVKVDEFDIPKEEIGREFVIKSVSPDDEGFSNAVKDESGMGWNNEILEKVASLTKKALDIKDFWAQSENQDKTIFFIQIDGNSEEAEVKAGTDWLVGKQDFQGFKDHQYWDIIDSNLTKEVAHKKAVELVSKDKVKNVYFKTSDDSLVEGSLTKKADESEETKQFGVFSYFKDNDENLEPNFYFDTKEEAVKFAKNIYGDEDKGEEKGIYVEVWEKDKDGLWGNSGEPILHLEAAKKKKEEPKEDDKSKEKKKGKGYKKMKKKESLEKISLTREEFDLIDEAVVSVISNFKSITGVDPVTTIDPEGSFFQDVIDKTVEPIKKHVFKVFANFTDELWDEFLYKLDDELMKDYADKAVKKEADFEELLWEIEIGNNLTEALTQLRESGYHANSGRMGSILVPQNEVDMAVSLLSGKGFDVKDFKKLAAKKKEEVKKEEVKKEESLKKEAASIKYDIFGRGWKLPERELCPKCGQPDNVGDCNCRKIGREQAEELGAVMPVWERRRKQLGKEEKVVAAKPEEKLKLQPEVVVVPTRDTASPEDSEISSGDGRPITER